MDSISRAGSDHPDPAFRRLDHLICVVGDIERAFELFTDRLGFSAAWPIGRFWPSAKTCGIALGGVNLELIEPDDDKPDTARITTLVFEPTSLGAAERAFARQGIPLRRFEKLEADRELLSARGFSRELAEAPQLICTNLYPEPPMDEELFVCEYSPLLKAHLNPNNPRFAYPHGTVLEVVLERPAQSRAWDTIRDAGYLGPIAISQTFGAQWRVRGIKMEAGALELGGFAAEFGFF